MSDKPQLHFSGLDLLWKCGIQFQFRHIQRIKMQPSSAIHVGRGVDEASNTNLNSKIDTDQLLPTEQVLDIARDVVTHNFDTEGAMLMPDEPNEKTARAMAVDKAVRLTKAHATVLAPTLKPKSVQRKWTVEIPGFPYDIVGTRDLDETDGTIRDLKTAGKTPNRNAAEMSDQLSMYALSKFVVDKTPPPIRVVLDTIVDLKKETKIDLKESTRDKSDFGVILRRIENAAEILQKEAFTPARQTDWFCSLKWCSYATICPFFRRPKTFAGGFEE
jgi:hypothetical protein